MKTRKLFSLFMLITFVNTNLQAADIGNYEKIAVNKDLADSGQLSLQYLEEWADASWRVSGISSAVFFGSACAAVIPATVVCEVIGEAFAICAQVAAPTAAIFGVVAGVSGLVAIFSTLDSSCDSYNHRPRLEFVQLIKDAYTFDPKSKLRTSLHDFYDDYLNQNMTCTSTIAELARALIVANEGGYFAPANAFINEVREDVSELKFVGSLSAGEIININNIIKNLLKVSLDDLEQNRAKFQDVLGTYRAEVEKAQQEREKKESFELEEIATK